jgi:bifunctional polynucleotide phosphatase/kinase
MIIQSRSFQARTTFILVMKRLNSSGGVSPPPLRRKVESTTTSEYQPSNISKAKLLTISDQILETAVASFFTPISQKKPEKITWRIVNKSLIAGKYTSGPGENAQTQPPKRRKVAAFDLVCATTSSPT